MKNTAVIEMNFTTSAFIHHKLGKTLKSSKDESLARNLKIPSEVNAINNYDVIRINIKKAKHNKVKFLKYIVMTLLLINK